nr:MAG TPA: hypothetical protein [Caudoviricetes sp.]
MKSNQSEFDLVVSGVYWGIGKLFKAVKSGVTSTLEMLPTKENKQKALRKTLEAVKATQLEHKRELVRLTASLYRDSDEDLSMSIEEACDNCFFEKDKLLTLVNSLKNEGYNGQILGKDINLINDYQDLPIKVFKDLFDFEDECNNQLKIIARKNEDLKAYNDLANKISTMPNIETRNVYKVSYKQCIEISKEIVDFLAQGPAIEPSQVNYLEDMLKFVNSVIEANKAKIEEDAIRSIKENHEKNLKDVKDEYEARLKRQQQETRNLKNELDTEIEELNDRISELEDENSSIAEQRDMFGMFGIKQYSDNQALKDALNK